MWGAAARMALKTPVRLVSTVSDHPAASRSKIGPQGRHPGVGHQDVDRSQLVDHPVDEGDHGVEVPHVRRSPTRSGAPRPRPVGPSRPGRPGWPAGRCTVPQVGAPVDQGDVGALAGQLDGVAAALAAGAAGDHRHPSGELARARVPAPTLLPTRCLPLGRPAAAAAPVGAGRPVGDPRPCGPTAPRPAARRGRRRSHAP